MPWRRTNGHERVHDEGVSCPIPRDIHEPNQRVHVVPGTCPTQAVFRSLPSPVVAEDRMAEAF
jgi:hypothetical protein